MKLKKCLSIVLSVVLIGGMSLPTQATEVVGTEDVSVEETVEDASKETSGEVNEEISEKLEEVTEEVTDVGVELQSGDYTYTILSDNTVEITGYTGNATTLNIPSTIEGRKVTSIGDSAFYGCISLTSVTIPNSVTSIGNYAFRDCSSLTKVTIPNSVTSIRISTFGNCSRLKEITIPSSVTYIGFDAFENTEWLRLQREKNPLVVVNGILVDGATCTGKVVIPNSVTSIGVGAFSGGSSLTEVTIPNSVTSIGGDAFWNCTSLATVTIPNSVTWIPYGTFEGCSSLVAVIIPDSVTSIEWYAFDGCPDNLVIYCNSGSYAHTFAVDYNIKYSFKKYFPQCTITLSSTTYTYDGTAKKPTVTVKDGTKTLKKDTDYTVTYSNNVKIGKATVTIVGKGNYEGTVKKTFTIKKGDYYNFTQNGGQWNGTNYFVGGVKMTDIFFSDGTYTYYLQADGTPMKNKLTYHPDGVHLIYFDDKGHELFDQFQYCKDVKYTCYFNSYGYLYKDEITFKDGNAYYLDGNGKMQQNGWFQFANGVDYGYANSNGTLINNGFGYDSSGRVVFFHWNGMVARGLITDGVWYYHMDETDGHLVGQFAAN